MNLRVYSFVSLFVIDNLCTPLLCRGAEPILKAAKLASVAPLLQPPTSLPPSTLVKNVETVEAK